MYICFRDDDQNHPLILFGFKCGLSQPLKSHKRPAVQMDGMRDGSYAWVVGRIKL